MSIHTDARGRYMWRAKLAGGRTYYRSLTSDGEEELAELYAAARGWAGPKKRGKR